MERPTRGSTLWMAVFLSACTGADGSALDAMDPGETGVTDSGGTDDIATPDPGRDPVAAFEQARGVVTDWMGTWHVPGASLAVVLDGHLAYDAAFGVKEEGGTDPVDADTLFHGGSMGKIVTALAVLTAVREGLLDLDAPLARAVPYFAMAEGQDASTITLRRLLSHTSGISEWNTYSFPMDAEKCASDGTTLSQYWHQSTSAVQWFPAGTLWLYSMTGYSLAGLALEEATKSAFADAITSRVLQPAGMQAAVAGLQRGAAAPNRASGHLVLGDAAAPLPLPGNECLLWEPAGSVWASARDWARLIEVFLADGAPLLTPALHDAMVTPVTQATFFPPSQYALGLYALDHGGHRVLHHGGAYSNGFIAYFLFVPDARFGLVLMANGMGEFIPTLPAVVGAVTDAFLGIGDVGPDIVAKSPPSDWSVYEGTYYEPTVFGTSTVSLDGDQLSVRMKDFGDLVVPLQQYTGDVWIGDFLGQKVEIDFWRTADAPKATHIITQAGIFQRQPD